MLVWVVSFFLNGKLAYTDVFKTKEVLLECLELRGFDPNKVWFDKSLNPYDRDEEVSVRYYGADSDRRYFIGELQYIYDSIRD